MRTALAFFLGREMKDVTDEEVAEQRHESHAHAHAHAHASGEEHVAQSETGTDGGHHASPESAAGGAPIAKLPANSAHSKKRR